MLSDRERKALEQWYARDEVLAEARRYYEAEEDEDLEEYLHMRCLIPLSRHSALPDYLKDERGEPLFPTNLNPSADAGKWQDAIEVGWAVMERELGFTHEQIHRRIATLQQRTWDAFLADVERRKKKP
jgi:hypothetical protein